MCIDSRVFEDNITRQTSDQIWEHGDKNQPNHAHGYPRPNCCQNTIQLGFDNALEVAATVGPVAQRMKLLGWHLKTHWDARSESVVQGKDLLSTTKMWWFCPTIIYHTSWVYSFLLFKCRVFTGKLHQAVITSQPFWQIKSPLGTSFLLASSSPANPASGRVFRWAWALHLDEVQMPQMCVQLMGLDSTQHWKAIFNILISDEQSMDYHGFESTIGPSSLLKPLEPRPMGFGASIPSCLQLWHWHLQCSEVHWKWNLEQTVSTMVIYKKVGMNVCWVRLVGRMFGCLVAWIGMGWLGWKFSCSFRPSLCMCC